MSLIGNLTSSGIPDLIMNLPAEPEQPPDFEVKRSKVPTGRSSLSEEEQVEQWRTRIAAFKTWQEELKLDEWDDRVYRLLENTPEADEESTELDYTNWIYAFWDIRKSGLSKRDPMPKLWESAPKYRNSVKQVKAALRWTVRETSAKDEVDRALDDALLSRYGGFVTTKYHSEFFPRPTQVDEQGHQTDKTGEPSEHSPVIKYDNVVFKYISAKDMYFEPGCRIVRDASWVGLAYDRSLEDLKREARYDKVVLGSIIQDRKDDTDQPDDLRKVRIVEIWSKTTQKVFVIAEDEGECGFLVKPKKWPYDLDGEYPVRHFVFNPHRDNPYQISPAGTFVGLVEQYNELRDNAMQKSRNTIPMTVSRAGTIGEEGRIQRINAIPGCHIEIEGDPAGITGWPIPEATGDEHRLMERLAADIRFVSGIDENQAGVNTADNSTATEAIIRSQASFNRKDRLQIAFDMFWGQVLRNGMFLIQQFWPVGRYVPLMDLEGNELEDMMEWSDDARNAEFSYIGIEAQSTAPPSKQSQQAEATNFLTMLTQYVPAVVNAAIMAKQIPLEISVPGLLGETLRSWEDDINLKKVFPTLSLNHNPDIEHRTVMRGGDIAVLPFDDDKLHIATHLPFLQMLELGQYDYEMSLHAGEMWATVKEQASDKMRGHIAEHNGKMQLTTSGTPENQGMDMTLRGGPEEQGTTAEGGAMGTPAVAGQANSRMADMRNAGGATQDIAAAMGRMGGQGASQGLLGNFQGMMGVG